MNFFGWKRQSRKWLTVAVTAVMSLTLLPAQGRSETFWQIIVTLAKPQKPQCQCCPNAECCPEGRCVISPECCPQGVCTGACTMPCCPVDCGSCNAQIDKLYRVAAICSMLGHHEAAQYFYYLAKKVSAKVQAQAEWCPCPVNKPHRGCQGCCEECCPTPERQPEKLRCLCAEQARTIEEIHAMLTDLTREVSALREEVQMLHNSQATHFTAPCTIQPTHWIVPPPPSSLPPHTLTPHNDPSYQTGPHNYYPNPYMPLPQTFNRMVPAPGIPYLQSWQGGFNVAPDAPATQPDRTQVFEFYIGHFR